MADTANRLISAQQDAGGKPDAFLVIPGISEDDARFLDQLWVVLRAGDDPQPLDRSQIQEQVEATLRAKPEVAAYQRGLQRLAKAHPDKADTAGQHAQQLGFFSNQQSHFLELTLTAAKIQWRFYINPVPASAPDLLSSLYQRLEAKGVLAKVGMKISAYDGLCRCRDGIVLYTDDAGKDAVSAATAEEGSANSGRFSRDLVRFTKPVANGLAGLGPDPQGKADLWPPLVNEWSAQNKGWVKEYTPDWDAHPHYMSYTQLLGNLLTTCYLLARSYRPRVRARGNQQSNLTVPEDTLRAQYQNNVIAAFKTLAINPSIPSLTPSADGVGWLRYRFFPQA